MVSDEDSTEVIRNYPAIYDKNSPAHKNSNTIQNAWKEVVSKTGIENVDAAKKRFFNIKKRFNN